jgi:hypothetical protein
MTGREVPPTAAGPAGARPRAEVERVHRARYAAAAEPQRQTKVTRGALSGYLWALGQSTRSPITGPDASGHVPEL